MKPWIFAGLLLVPFLVLVPGASAAAEPVPGVSILVTGDDGTDAFFTIRFFVAPDDPDQDLGTYTYNYTRLITGGSWNTHESDIADISDGIGTVFDDFTLGMEVTVNITADDGTGPVDSCTVTVTLAEGAFDACGGLDADTAFADYFCLATTAEASGFNYERRVEVVGGELEFDAGFSANVDRLAVGGLNLGGDVSQIQLTTQMRFDSDFLIGQARVFFSEVDVSVSETAFGDGATTGAFTDGTEFVLSENGNAIGLEVRLHNSGSVTSSFVDNDFLPSGANSNQAVIFTIHPDTLSIELTIGTSTHYIGQGETQPGFHSLWVSEGWDESGSKSIWAGGSGFCLGTYADANPATPGTGGSGQALEDFDGQGGFGGDPAFPGIAIEEDNPLGITRTAFALVMAAVLVGGSVILAWQWSMIGGAVLGGVTAMATAAVLNLVPLWSIVVFFMGGVTVIVLWRRS